MFTQCGFQIVQSCHQGCWRGFSLSCAKCAESLVLLDLPSARRTERDESTIARLLSALRGLLGQLMWRATQVIPQLQAPSSLLLGYVGVATVSTMLEAKNLFDVRWFGLRHHCEPLLMTVFVSLDGLAQVGLVAVMVQRKVSIWLESRTGLSWNKHNVR